jgi:hypothetical protein
LPVVVAVTVVTVPVRYIGLMFVLVTMATVGRRVASRSMDVGRTCEVLVRITAVSMGHRSERNTHVRENQQQ